MKKNKLLGIVFLLSLSGCNVGNTSNSSSSKVSNTNSVSVSTNSSSMSSSSSSSSMSSSSSSSSTSSSSSSLRFSTEEEIKEALELGINNKSKVQKGVLNLKTSSESKVEYVFGNDKYGISTKFINKDSIDYYGYDAQNVFYGLTDKNGSLSSSANQDENFLFGPSVDVYNGTKYYGAEGLLTFINELVNQNSNLDFEILGSYSGYKFKVSFVEVVNNQPRLYLNTVQFNIGENNILSYLDVKVDKYTNTSTQTNVIPDFSTNTYYLSLTAKPTTSYTVNYEQFAGERETDSSYDIENLLFKSFDLVTSTNSVLGTDVTLKKGTKETYTISNFLPDTANAAVDKLKVKVVSGDSAVSGTYNSSNGKITLNPTKIGNCVIEISSRRVTKTINVTVGEPDPTSISVMYYSKSGSSFEYNIIDESKHIDIYENTSIYLKASFQPTDANQKFGVKAIGDNKESVTYEDFIVDNGLRQFDTIKTTFLAKGNYTIEVYSLNNEELKETLTVSVNDAPSFEELINNRYVQKSADSGFGVDINFTPSVDNLKVGSVSISDAYETKDYKNKTYSYTYDEETKVFTLMDGTNVSLAKLEFNDKFNLIYTRLSSQVEVQLIVYSPIVEVSGEWSGNICTDEEGIRHSITISFRNDGSGSFQYSSIKGFSSTGGFEVSINASAVKGEDDTVNITFDEASLNRIYSKNIITSISNIVGCSTSVALSVTFNGVNYNVNLTPGG